MIFMALFDVSKVSSRKNRCVKILVFIDEESRRINYFFIVSSTFRCFDNF